MKISRGEVNAVHLDHFVFQGSREYASSYEGVIVIWDEDLDTRVLTFLDEMDHTIRKHLVLCSEHKASLTLLWESDYIIPGMYKEGKEIICELDCWWIEESINI